MGCACATLSQNVYLKLKLLDLDAGKVLSRYRTATCRNCDDGSAVWLCGTDTHTRAVLHLLRPGLTLSIELWHEDSYASGERILREGSCVCVMRSFLRTDGLMCCVLALARTRDLTLFPPLRFF